MLKGKVYRIAYPKKHFFSNKLNLKQLLSFMAYIWSSDICVCDTSPKLRCQELVYSDFNIEILVFDCFVSQKL